MRPQDLAPAPTLPTVSDAPQRSGPRRLAGRLTRRGLVAALSLTLATGSVAVATQVDAKPRPRKGVKRPGGQRAPARRQRKAAVATPPSTPQPAGLQLSVSARVTQVNGDGTVVVNRGALDGLEVAESGVVVHPNRVKAGAKSRSVDTLIRLARGDVVSVTPHSANVRLRLVTDKVQVGDHASWLSTVPAKDSSLLRLAAYDIGLVTLRGKKPLLSFHALRRGVPQGPMWTAMVEEIRSHASVATQVYKQPIPGGRFHGRTLKDAFSATTADDLRAFVDFVVAFPGKYIGRDWKLVNVYATWVINRTPSGRTSRIKRETLPTRRAAKAAETAGDLAKAEQLWRAVIKAWPGNATAKLHLNRLAAVAMHRRVVSRRPADHAARWKLALELYRLRAHELALAELLKLERAGHDVRRVQIYRARTYVRQERFAEALALFQALLAKRPDKGLQKWVSYAKARASIAAKTGSFAAHMAIARIDEAEGSYDNAQRRLRLAADGATTATELKQVRAAQLRLRDLRSIESLGEKLKRGIRSHTLGKVQLRAASLVTLGRRHKRTKRVDKLLSDAADVARDVWERATAELLQQARVDLGHDRADALRDLAWIRYSGGQRARAKRALGAALDADAKSAYAHHMAGLIAVLDGDLDAAARYARAAIQRSKTYPWPRLTLARVAFARSRWDDGVEMTLAALTQSPQTRDLQLAYSNALALRRAAVPAKDDRRSLARRRLHALRLWLRFDLYGRAERTLKMLKGSAHFDAGCWAVLTSTEVHLPRSLLAVAVDGARPRAGWQSRLLTEARARLALGDPKLKGRTLALARIDLARAYVRRGAFHRAVATLGKLRHKASEADLKGMAVDIAEAARKGLRGDRLVQRAAEARKRGGQWPLVARLQGEANAIYAEIGSLGDAASAAFYEAFAIAAQGKLDDALALLTRVEKRFAGQMPPLATLDLALAHASLKGQRGLLSAHREAVEAAVATCEALDEEVCVAQTSLNDAALALGEGRLGAARAAAERVLTFAETRRMATLARHAIFQKADIALVAGDLVTCRTLAVQLLKRSRKAVDAANERLGLMLLGAVAMRRGEAKEATQRFSEVLALGRRIGEASVQATALLFLGHTALNAAHDPKTAAVHYRAAAALWDRLADPERSARSRYGLGRALAKSGAVAEARTLLDGVVTWSRAKERRPLLSDALAARAWVEIDHGQPKAALPFARAAHKVAQSIDMEANLQGALHVLGKALVSSGDLKGGAPLLQAATKILARRVGRSGGEGAQRGFLDYGRTRQVYKDTIDALLKAGRINEAMAVIELSRDANLRKMFDPSRIKAKDKGLKKTLTGLGSAEKQAHAARKQLAEERSKPKAERNAARIAALDKRVAESDGKVRRLLLRLKARHQGLYQAFAVDPRSLVNDRHHLPKDALVVAYFIAGDDLYIFTIARSRAQAHAYKVALKGANLGTLVAKYRRALEKKNPRMKRLGRKLHRYLIKPIAHELAGARTLLFMPAGPLYFLPFHALEKKVKGKSRYLIEDHRVAYLLSTTVGELQRPVRHGVRARLAAFANPDGSLPGARAEVLRVKKDAYPAAAVYFGQAADKKRVELEAGRHHVLHFATHGILDPDPLRSHLKMAKGTLTVDDIAGIEFSRETTLIVLSACQTAVAVGSHMGEGISIAEAFATAGVPTLVASLWNVPDASTSELMSRFYLHLKAARGDTLDALRQAQLEVMNLEVAGRRPFAHPVFWAGFELIGDYR